MAGGAVNAMPDLLPEQAPHRAIDRIDAPSAAHFDARYVRSRRPVVLRGLCEGWPARRLGLEALVRDFGDVDIPVARMRGGSFVVDRRRGVIRDAMRLGDYVATLRAGKPAGYLSAREEELPRSLRAAAPAPDYCRGAGFHVMKLWLAAPAMVTALHFDLADNLHTQLLGRKRFLLVSPRDSRCVYPNGLLSSVPNGCAVDLERPDAARFPRLARARLHVAEILPGETLYIPRGWWHHVRTMQVSLSINHWWARGWAAAVAHAADLFKRIRGISR